MSRFTTSIPIEVKAFIESLPRGSYVHSVTLVPPMTNENRYDIMAGTIQQEVVILWENDKFHSGLTVPVDFPAIDVKRKILPKGVLKPGSRKPATLTPPEPENAPTGIVEPLKAPSGPSYLTAEQVDRAVTDGNTVEFQGIEPIWKEFNPKVDTFMAGYFYRVKQVAEQPVLV